MEGAAHRQHCATELNDSAITLQVQFHLLAEKWLLLRCLFIYYFLEIHPRSCPGFQSCHACDPWVLWEHHGIHCLWDWWYTGCFNFEICVCWKASNSVACMWPLAACFNIQQVIWISCIEDHKNLAFCVYLLIFMALRRRFYSMVLLWVFGLITYLMSVIHVCRG